MKCVYVAEFDNSVVKIGITKNLKTRLEQLSYVVKHQIINCRRSDFCPPDIALSVEKACHSAFEDKRIEGEFFNISFADACAELDSHAGEIDAANETALKIQTVRKALYRFYKDFGVDTPIKFASATGINEVVSEIWGSDTSMLTLGVLIKLAKKFNVSTDYILGLADKPSVTETFNLSQIATKKHILDYHQELSRVLAKQGIKI